jgi:hypothetical protein
MVYAACPSFSQILLQPFLGCQSTIAEGKPIPTELRKEEAQLRKEVELEDDNTAVPRSHVDDEYASASLRDPKVLVTTSRDPSSRLIQFSKVGILVVVCVLDTTVPVFDS